MWCWWLDVHHHNYRKSKSLKVYLDAGSDSVKTLASLAYESTIYKIFQSHFKIDNDMPTDVFI